MPAQAAVSIGVFRNWYGPVYAIHCHSRQGLELDMGTLVPEVTVNLDGVFWHPFSTDADMKVSRTLFPLLESVEEIREHLDTISLTGKLSLMTFT